ncbi:MAG: hypothetical protein R3E89_15055 [Thiolinea sp.]
MDATVAYYRNFLPAAQLLYVQHPEANHAMITEDVGSACKLNQPPYINDCDLDAAGALLNYLHGLLQAKQPADPQALHAFKQNAFFDTGDTSVSLHEQGHIYIPAACQREKPVACIWPCTAANNPRNRLAICFIPVAVITSGRRVITSWYCTHKPVPGKVGFSGFMAQPQSLLGLVGL